MSKDPCACGSITWHYFRIKCSDKGELYRGCSDCLTEKTPSLSPDVFFDASKGSNQTDPNLCDRYKGKIPFSSKREKAAILKNKGIREAGDKMHGARNWDKTASKQWEGM